MLLQDKQIAIIGGGPGGLTLARLLQLQGANIKVYERDLNKDARVQGSPLDLHDDSGLAAIIKAGLLEQFKAGFMRGADRMVIANPLAEILYSEHGTKKEQQFGDKNFRPEIDRGVLRRMLLESLDPGTVVWNRQFLSMAASNDGWLLHFKNGEPAYADLVVAADGANSRIRPYVTDIKPFYSGITMLEGNVYDAVNKVPAISALLRGGKIMAFGNKQNILMGQKANGEIGFYASFRAEVDWIVGSAPDFADNDAMLAWFKKEYAGWSTVWHELFENANTPFIPRPIFCAPLEQYWEPLPNVTLLGDAAHVMPPFAGEGVNMAMLDALELSESLSSRSFSSLQEAIGHYESAMRKRAAVMAKESIENGERMHSENALEMMLGFFKGEFPRLEHS